MSKGYATDDTAPRRLSRAIVTILFIASIVLIILYGPELIGVAR